MEPNPMLPQNDHDLLVVVHTNQNHMAADLKSIKEDLSPRLRVVETMKLERTELTAALLEIKRDFETAIKPLLDGRGDHESRIRRIERYSWLILGGLIVIQVIIQAAFSSKSVTVQPSTVPAQLAAPVSADVLPLKP